MLLKASSGAPPIPDGPKNCIRNARRHQRRKLLEVTTNTIRDLPVRAKYFETSGVDIRRAGGIPVPPTVQFVPDFVHMVRLGFVLNDFGNQLLKLTFLLSLDFVRVRGICVTRNRTETSQKQSFSLVPNLLSSSCPSWYRFETKELSHHFWYSAILSKSFVKDAALESVV